MDYFREIFEVIEEQRKIQRQLTKLSEQTEIVERFAKQDSLEINGIPEQYGENLVRIIIRLSNLLGCRIREIDIYSSRRIRIRHPRPIMVRFSNRLVRDRLISAAITFNLAQPNDSLNSRHLDFNGIKIPVLLSAHPSRLNIFHRIQARDAARAGKKKKSASKKSKKTSRSNKPHNETNRVKSLRTLALLAYNKHTSQ